MHAHTHTQDVEKKAEDSAFNGYVPFGREMQAAIMLGLLSGGGLGALRWARDRAGEHRSVLPPKPPVPKPDYRFQIPESFEERLDDFESPRSKKSAVEKTADIDNLDMLLPLLGAGAGGLYGAVSSKPGQKLKGIMRGVAGGGALGLTGTALRSDAVADRLGRIPAYFSSLMGSYPENAANLPPRASNPVSAIGNALASTLNTDSIDWAHSAIRGPASILAGLGSGGLAWHVLEKMRINDLRARRENAVANAREEYFNALLGDSKDEAKNQKTAALDALYENYVAQEKTSEAGQSWMDYLFSGESVGDGLRFTTGLAGLSALAGGLLAGPYMYQRGRRENARRALEQAQDARKRYRSRHTPWIDPEELAAISKIAR